MYSTSACPLVAEQPWTVVSNDGKVLRIKHPNIRHVLDLPYATLLEGVRSPAVFRITNRAYGTAGPIYCILQFVGHWLPEEQVSESFVNNFSEDAMLEALDDDRVRTGLLEKWSETLQGFRLNGFGYKSIKRLALMSQCAEKDLHTIRNGDWAGMMLLGDRTLVNLQRALSWLPHYLRQSSYIAHDFDAEYSNKD